MLCPDNENKRLDVLHQYEILDTPPEEAFDELTHLAANLCETPIALISLVDDHREWFKSKVGITTSEFPRSLSFGGYTILEPEILIIPDILQDKRFAVHPLVVSVPYFRSYAGVPIVTSSGLALGTICVVDFVTRQFGVKEQAVLQNLARQVMRYLEIHRKKIIHDSRNIREYKGIELNLEESEARFRAISEAIPVPLIISRLSDGLILYANQECVKRFRISLEDLVNCQTSDLYFDPAKYQKLLTAFTQHGSIQDYEIQLQRADGTYFWAIASLHNLSFNGEAAILKVFYDITERKNAEAKLQEQNEFLQTIFESLPLMIAIIDVNGKFQWVNQELERILGWNLQDFQTRDVFAELYPHPEERQHVINFIQAGQPVWSDFRTRLRDGRILNTSWTNMRLANGQTIWIGQDITTRKQAEANLRSALAEKEVLLKEIHHRVKNNLQIVSSLLQLQSQTLNNPELIRVIKESQNRIDSISLIHKNLYTAPNIGQFDVGVYIDNLATSLLSYYQISPRKIGLETHIEPVQLNLDQAIVCGLIINELISNALKHGFTNQQVGTIIIGLHNLTDFIEMTIQDNGIGLPNDFDCSNASSLGLSLVHDLVTEQLEGTMIIETHHGTLFKIRFPQLTL